MCLGLARPCLFGCYMNWLSGAAHAWAWPLSCCLLAKAAGCAFGDFAVCMQRWLRVIVMTFFLLCMVLLWLVNNGTCANSEFVRTGLMPMQVCPDQELSCTVPIPSYMQTSKAPCSRYLQLCSHLQVVISACTYKAETKSSASHCRHATGVS